VGAKKIFRKFWWGALGLTAHPPGEWDLVGTGRMALRGPINDFGRGA